MLNAESLMGPSAAARELGVSAVTVRNWAAAGKLPVAVVTAEGHRLFSAADVERLAAERRAKEVASG